MQSVSNMCNIDTAPCFFEDNALLWYLLLGFYVVSYLPFTLVASMRNVSRLPASNTHTHTYARAHTHTHTHTHSPSMFVRLKSEGEELAAIF